MSQAPKNLQVQKQEGLKSIPSDVANLIAACVRGPAEIGKQEKKAEKRKRVSFCSIILWNDIHYCESLSDAFHSIFFLFLRVRDVTLRSISLTSKRNYLLFHPSLLQTISIKPSDLHTIYSLLERDGQAGKAIKLLSIDGTSENADSFQIPFREKMNVKIANVSSCGDSCPHHHPVADNEKALRFTLGFVLHHLDNLQTLILHYPPLFKLPLVVDKVAKSLVKLHIGRGLSLQKPGLAQGQEHISGKNSIWLLLFCPFLRQVILSGCITVEDERFFADHVDTYRGLSTVKDISLSLVFWYDPKRSKSWWGTAQEKAKTWRFGSRKSDAIFNLLQVTNGLNSCELAVNRFRDRQGDETVVQESVLLGICGSAQSRGSLDTLVHLRYFGGRRMNSGISSNLDYSRFTALKIISFDTWTLLVVQASRSKLPKCLETLCLNHYSFPAGNSTIHNARWFEEERILEELLARSSFPTLKEVGVPRAPWDVTFEEATDPALRERWSFCRESLTKLGLFRSGKVRLRLLKPREIGE